LLLNKFITNSAVLDDMDMEDQKEDTEDQTGGGLRGSLTVSFLLNPLVSQLSICYDYDNYNQGIE